MSSTNKTTYYDLPQFVDNDIFNPLVDDNDAYEKIDTALHNIANAEADDASEIVSIKSRLDSAEGDIDTLETQNGNSVLTTTAQTLSGAINELDADTSALDGRLDIVEDDINNVSTGLKAKVSALETQNGNEVLTTTAQTLSGAINELDSIIDNMKLLVINVKDYGAKGDGVTNDYPALAAIIEEHKETGCVMYFPSGKYNINKTLCIPSNFIIKGDGYCSFIYLTNPTLFAGAIGICGDNVFVSNIRVGFFNDETTAPTSGSIHVGLGISNWKYEAAIEENFVINSTNCEDRSNVHVDKIYCTGVCCLQCESAEGFNMTGISYSHIYAPNAFVTVTPSANSIYRDINVDDVVCGCFRYGVGHGGNKGANVSNITAYYIRLLEQHINASNLVVNNDVDNAFYTANLYQEALAIFANNVVVTNAVINGDVDKTGTKYGLHIANTISTKVVNVIAKNFSNYNAYNGDGTKSYFINCDFTDARTSVTTIVYGFGANLKANMYPAARILNLYEEATYTPTYATDVTSHDGANAPTSWKVNGNVGEIHAFLNCTNGANGKLISCNDNRVKPKTNHYFYGIGYASTAATVVQPIPMVLNTDGEVIANPSAGGFSTAYDRIMFSTTYTIGE